MQISEKRLQANRANAARSTGPVTPEGKARAAANATRHGLLAKQILVGNECPDNFKALCDILLQRFAPGDDFEYGLIEELAAAYWRLRRAWALETEMLENAMQKQSARRQFARMDAAFGELAAQPKLGLLHRYESRLHLMYQRALHSLLLLRQIAPPGKKYANEPKTPFPCNEFTAETPPKTAPNTPKTAPKRPNPPLSRQRLRPAGGVIRRGQIPTIPAPPD
jgi:hypothetical protein